MGDAWPGEAWSGEAWPGEALGIPKLSKTVEKPTGFLIFWWMGDAWLSKSGKSLDFSWPLQAWSVVGWGLLLAPAYAPLSISKKQILKIYIIAGLGGGLWRASLAHKK